MIGWLPRRKARTAMVICTLVLVLTGVAGPAFAQSAGSVRRSAGQGPGARCEASPFESPADDGGAPISMADLRLRNNLSIAVTAAGALFLGERIYVRSESGLVAGKRGSLEVVGPNPVPSTGGLRLPEANGAVATEVKLDPVVGIAVDALGHNLFVAEQVSVDSGRVRWVNLQESAPTIRELATTGTITGIAAQSNNVYIREQAGPVLRVQVPGGQPTIVANLPGPGGLAVDGGGTALFAANPDTNTVVRVDLAFGGTTPVRVAGSGTAGYSGDGGPATSAALSGPTAVAVDPLGTNLYIIDQRSAAVSQTSRIRRVALETGVITTVVGQGGVGQAGQLALDANAIAVDYFNNLHIADSNACQVLFVQSPAPLPKEPLVPVSPGPNAGDPDGGAGTGDPKDVVQGGSNPEPVPTNGDPNVIVNPDPGTNVNPGGAGGENQTGIISNTQAQNQTQILEQAQSPVGQEPVVQPTPQPRPTPTPTPTPDASGFAAPVNPSPTPTPTPDPGAAVGGAADAGVVAPVSPPAPAPVPPAPDPSPAAGSVAPPPAAQPVSNIGLAGGDGEAARGATRYAMVRSDDDESAVAALSMVLGGVVLAGFPLCVMFVAPGASSKPRPRPKGAY